MRTLVLIACDPRALAVLATIARELRQIARTVRGEAQLNEPGWPLRLEHLGEQLAVIAEQLRDQTLITYPDMHTAALQSLANNPIGQLYATGNYRGQLETTLESLSARHAGEVQRRVERPALLGPAVRRKEDVVLIDRFEGPEHGFLSNFHPSPISMAGRTAATAEHAYQACKTLDPAWFDRVLSAPTPGAAKRVGRELPLRRDWEAFKVPAMRSVVELKFAAGSELGGRLLATGDALLLEGNGWGDRFWGAVWEGGRWSGSNWLGHLLMARRAELRGGAP